MGQVADRVLEQGQVPGDLPSPVGPYLQKFLKLLKTFPPAGENLSIRESL